MKIAINARFLIKNKLEGIGWYSFEMIKRIVVAHPEHDFILLFDRQFDKEFIFASNVIPVIVQPPARHPVLWFFWFQFSVPYILKKYKADLFFSPDGFIPIACSIKTITTIHDINFEAFPEFVPKLTAAYYRYFFPKFARSSNSILTVSQFSKNELIKYYQIPPNKIIVAYNGLNEAFIQSDIQYVDNCNLEENKPYFLFVGALSPRKNIVSLLKAFDLFKQKTGLDYKLLIVGEKLHLCGTMLEQYTQMQYQKDVVFLGRLELKQLICTYKNAFALLFLPLYEGFGIPLLEAMASGTPIIASDIPVFREVAGDAALFVDCANIDLIAEKMHHLIENKELYKQLIVAGLNRVTQFSWNKSAEIVWNLIEQNL
jgi:glycosyltransferase involved in cell wall biosynthesis